MDIKDMNKDLLIILSKIKNLDRKTQFKCLASDIFKTYILYGKTGATNKNLIKFIFFDMDLKCKYIFGYFVITDDRVEFIIDGGHEHEMANELNFLEKLTSLKGDLKFFSKM